MSRGFIKEGDQEEIPMVPPRAYLPQDVPNYVTKEGLAALNEELKNLKAERAKAGDNYIMGNFIDAKMKLLVDRINSALEVDLAKANKDTVSFGAWVRYNGRVVRIVGVDEADVDQGLIAFTSPIAKLLTGKKAGDIFELKGSRGTEKIKVEEVSFEPMPLTRMAREKLAPTSLRAERSNPQLTSVDFLPSVEEPLGCVVANAPRNEEELTCQTSGKEEAILSSKVEEPHGFVPEVDPMEFLPMVNERGNIVGRALYLELHKGNKMLHPAVHLHVINAKGEPTGLYWWHVAFGDTPEKTLKRKMAEALGLQKVKPTLKRHYIRESKTEKELVYVFTVISEEKLPKNPATKEYLELFAKDEL